MNLNREPIAIPAGITTIVVLVIGFLAPQMGWDAQLTADIEVAAISVMAAIAAVFIVVSAWFSRSKVDSPATVAQKVDDALHTAVPEDRDGPDTT